MKKILPFLLLFLFSCQQHIKLEYKPTAPAKPIAQIPQISESKTHDQFESRNLQTAKIEEKKTQIALFLPFSGKNKELGWSLFNAATISLFDNDQNHAIELVLIDSKDTEKEAQEAFKQIVERKIRIVIGPVFSGQIAVIEKEAKRNKITMVSLSNNQDLMGKVYEDGGVFLAGILPEAQMDHIIEYAIEQDKESFAVIAPNNQFGRTMAGLFTKIVRNRDGNIITSELYEPNGLNIERAVERVVSAFSLPSHMTIGKSKIKKDVVITDADRVYAQVILIPESGKNLSKVAAALKKLNKDERNFQLIGTNQWDDLVTLNDANLLGAWFPAPENTRFRNFERAYYQSFSKFPPRISSLVYDLTAAVVELVNRAGRNTAPSISDFINYANPPTNGFDGIDGLFRFLPNGLVQRNLAVLQVGNGKFDVIDRPADGFLKY
ncbi:MAG: penicillin-binding protein activator [Alphaproteobacteria bacterium]|nr:penicillin-binding protein activator [Alphaproteobacteria bacterium]